MKIIQGFLGSIRGYFRQTDILFWLMTVTASFYGLALIWSQQRSGDVNFIKTQIMAVILGYIAAVIISVIDYNVIAKFWWLISVVGIALTVAVFFIGIQVSGTDDTGWIRLPGGITFQPSELTKIFFILTFSKHLSYLTEINKLKTFLAVLTLVAHAAVPIVLIHLQGDDGAVLIFAFIFVIMSFMAGVQLRYFIMLGGAVLAAVPLIWTKFLNDDQKNRLLVLFSNDDSMIQNFGWQQYQGKVSIASGGFFGKGYYNGPRVESNMVPYQENDFIFTVAGEELGFLGCAAIIVLILIMCIKILHTSHLSYNPLGRLICIGFFALIAVQSIINLGMVLGIFPVVGITLPFFSSGGTSVACLYLGVGLVQSVYMHRTDVNLIGQKIIRKNKNENYTKIQPCEEIPPAIPSEKRTENQTVSV